jgi:histidinol-phosphate aminotransferase
MTTAPQLSRRSFAKIIGASAAYAAFRPATGGIVSHAESLPDEIEAAVVRLSANENPYGPSQAALKAMKDAFPLACRYPDEYEDALIESLRKLNNVSFEQILASNGSGEVLRLAAAAFTDSSRSLVLADPTFEAIAHHAQVAGAKVLRVSLSANYAHDLTKMAQATENVGLIYVCNPNNPTASITPKDQVRAFLAKVPSSTIILIDEAYHHYVESDSYESAIPLIEQYPNLIVARTFSKIYGMAGLRCGYCVAQPALIKAMHNRRTMDSVNIMALVAANASLEDTEHVAEGRRKNSAVKKFVCSELDKWGYKYIPSHANFMMIDLRREVRPVISSLKMHGVEVGRVFPALPNFLRVTIGTQPEMETFTAEFRKVMSSG